MFPSLTVNPSRRPKTAVARQPYVNFAYGRIANAPSPPKTGTMFTLDKGHAARFPAPPFRASIWAYAAPPDPDSAEVVTVLTVEGDTFTVVRAQEETTPRVIKVSDQISANVTAGSMNAIGFWRDLDVHDPAFYGVAVGEPLAVPTPGLWLPPTNPVSSYAWAEIGIGTIVVNFILMSTTLTQNMTPSGGGWFALKLPTSEFGQAWVRQGAAALGTISLRQVGGVYELVGGWGNYEDQWLRFRNPPMDAGTYDVASSVIVPCDWW